MFLFFSDVYYIHDVSPIKKAKSGHTQYFNCILQGEGSAKKAVCFSPKKHPLLHDASESHSPVKITRYSLSKNEEIIIADQTRVTLSKATFDCDERFQRDAVISLNDLHSLAPGQLLNTKCFVGNTQEVVEQKVRSGDVVQKQEVTISDSTSSVKLILYGDYVNSLTEGKSYLLKNVRLNSFKNTVYLNTSQTLDFIYEEMSEIPHVDDVTTIS